MKIDLLSLQKCFNTETKGVQSRHSDFDLRLNSGRLGTTEGTDNNLITSKFACTPGCGNTGTGNSFCCTC